MTDRDLLTEDEYREAVNIQAQHLVEAVESEDYDDDSLPYSRAVADVLDGHEWFDGSNYPTHHARIIELAMHPDTRTAWHDHGIDKTDFEKIARDLAYSMFQEDVLKTAMKTIV